MNFDRATSIFTLSSDYRWRDLVAEIEDHQKEAEGYLKDRTRDFPTTQYWRGVCALAERIKMMRNEAFEIINSMKGRKDETLER